MQTTVSLGLLAIVVPGHRQGEGQEVLTKKVPQICLNISGIKCVSQYPSKLNFIYIYRN